MVATATTTTNDFSRFTKQPTSYVSFLLHHLRENFANVKQMFLHENLGLHIMSVCDAFKVSLERFAQELFRDRDMNFKNICDQDRNVLDSDHECRFALDGFMVAPVRGIFSRCHGFRELGLQKKNEDEEFEYEESEKVGEREMVITTRASRANGGLDIAMTFMTTNTF
ncbi:hypothetical protein VNO77_42053 [Canavalia gladiata]|uniref:Uncharacterized protein n=1 Tax=Canavalia gladiata TaxID=3824 RepID=A0AAN9PT18_CANGL